MAQLKQTLGDMNLGDTIHVPLSKLPPDIIPDLRYLISTSPTLRTVYFRGFPDCGQMNLSHLQLLLESLAARQQQQKQHSTRDSAPAVNLRFYGYETDVDESAAQWRDALAKTFSEFPSLQCVHLCCENVQFARFWMSCLARSQTRVTQLSLQFDYFAERFDKSLADCLNQVLSSSSLTVTKLLLSGNLWAHATLLPVLTRWHDNRHQQTALRDCCVNLYFDPVVGRGVRSEGQLCCGKFSQTLQKICSTALGWQEEDKWAIVAKAIAGNASIRTLNIDGRDMCGDEGFVTTLRCLLLESQDLRALQLKDMDLIGATALSEMFNENKCLEKLSLDCIHMDSEERDALFQSLRQVQTLRELSIDARSRRGCVLHASGLMEFLRGNHDLKKLTLTGYHRVMSELTSLMDSGNLFVEDLTLAVGFQFDDSIEAFFIALHLSHIKALCVTRASIQWKLNDPLFPEFLRHLPFLLSLEHLRWERPICRSEMLPAVPVVRAHQTLLSIELLNCDSQDMNKYHRQLGMYCTRNRFQRLVRMSETKEESKAVALSLYPALFASSNRDATRVFVGLLQVSHILPWTVKSQDELETQD